jgi:AraC-like DNA-binding protein
MSEEAPKPAKKSSGNRATRRIQMNEKRRKLIKALEKGMSVTEAAQVAGYAHPQAAAYAYGQMRKQMPSLLAQEGMPITKLVQELVAKTKAKETKLITFQGVVMETRQIDDNRTQLAALDRIGKIYGVYPPNNERSDDEAPKTPTVNVHLEFLGRERGQEVLRNAMKRIGRSDSELPNPDIDVDEDGA